MLKKGICIVCFIWHEEQRWSDPPASSPSHGYPNRSPSLHCPGSGVATCFLTRTWSTRQRWPGTRSQRRTTHLFPPTFYPAAFWSTGGNVLLCFWHCGRKVGSSLSCILLPTLSPRRIEPGRDNSHLRGRSGSFLEPLCTRRVLGSLSIGYFGWMEGRASGTYLFAISGL